MSNLRMRAAALVRASALTIGLVGGVAFTGVAYADTVNLTWGMWVGSDAEKAAWQHVADMVTAKYPDIKITLQTASWPDYWTKLPTLAASNQLPDIVSLQSLRTPGFASLPWCSGSCLAAPGALSWPGVSALRVSLTDSIV